MTYFLGVHDVQPHPKSDRMNVRLTSLLVTASLVAAQADEQVRSVQEELRRRNVYFGDVDGRATPETQEALKRYQARKGFSTSGRQDPETLRSLGLQPKTAGEAPPKELSWPDETVLKSDVKVDVVKEATELAQDTGVAPEYFLPIGEKPRAAAAARKSHGAARPLAPGPASGCGSEAQAVNQQELLVLIGKYLQAASKCDLRRELGFYADHVDYYGNGKVDRRLIEASLHKYYAQWPHRSYHLDGVTAFSKSPKTADITITYQVSFTLKNKQAKVKGKTLDTIVINAGTASPRIVAIRESRVRG